MPPTEKQIDFAELIAYTLGIEFPTCSKQYTKWGYSQFISSHLAAFQQAQAEASFPDDYPYVNDAWTEYY